MLTARNMNWVTLYQRQTRRGRILSAVVAKGSSLRRVAWFLGFSDQESNWKGRNWHRPSALAEFTGAGILI